MGREGRRWRQADDRRDASAQSEQRSFVKVGGGEERGASAEV